MARHPPFGRRLALVSVSARRSDGHALVSYRDRMLLRVPVAATSLAPQQPREGPSKLTRESLRLRFDLRQRAPSLGWRDEDVEVIDADLGERRRRHPLGGLATSRRLIEGQASILAFSSDLRES